MLAVNCVKSHCRAIDRNSVTCELCNEAVNNPHNNIDMLHGILLVWAGFANAAAADACGNILRASMVDVSKILFFYLSGLWHCSLPDCHSSSSSTSQRRAVSQSVSFPEEANFFSFYFFIALNFTWVVNPIYFETIVICLHVA